MKVIVLSDNIASEQLKQEWGLSIFIEYEGKNILLDTGGSKLYLDNAKKLDIDIKKVGYGVLSHAHYDHANGMESFFDTNKEAKFYLRAGSGENCYFKFGIFSRYIGIRKGTLKTYKDRILFVDGDYELIPGITLVPHKTSNLAVIGKKNRMYIKKEGKWYPDDFSHEQSIVFETEKGLVILNSCCHTGADMIIREVANTFNDKHIYAIIGGFHLYNASHEEVKALANRIKDTGIEKVYTGHCTGEKSYQILKEQLGEKLEQFKVGLTIEV